MYTVQNGPRSGPGRMSVAMEQIQEYALSTFALRFPLAKYDYMRYTVDGNIDVWINLKRRSLWPSSSKALLMLNRAVPVD